MTRVRRDHAKLSIGGRGMVFTSRTKAGAVNVSVYGTNVVALYMVEITRSGGSFSAYESSNGTTWTQVGTAQTITMGNAVYLGMPLCNHGRTGTFSNLSVTP